MIQLLPRAWGARGDWRSKLSWGWGPDLGPQPQETPGCVEEVGGKVAVGDEDWLQTQDLEQFYLHLWSTHSQVPDGAGAQGLCHLLELLHLHLSQTWGRKKIRQLIQSISFTLPQPAILPVARNLEIFVLKKDRWHRNMKGRGGSLINPN